MYTLYLYIYRLWWLYDFWDVCSFLVLYNSSWDSESLCYSSRKSCAAATQSRASVGRSREDGTPVVTTQTADTNPSDSSRALPMEFLDALSFFPHFLSSILADVLIRPSLSCPSLSHSLSHLGTGLALPLVCPTRRRLASRDEDGRDRGDPVFLREKNNGRKQKKIIRQQQPRKKWRENKRSNKRTKEKARTYHAARHMRNEIPITYGGKFEFNQPRFKILPLCAISCSIWRTPTCLSSQTCPTSDVGF